MMPVSGHDTTEAPMAGETGAVAGADDDWLRATASRLRVPPPGWRALSACADADHELFVGELSAAQEASAKAICERCGVRDECLAFSIAHGVQYGVWGGMNGPERERVSQIWSEQRALGVSGRAQQTA